MILVFPSGSVNHWWWMWLTLTWKYCEMFLVHLCLSMSYWSISDAVGVSCQWSTSWLWPWPRVSASTGSVTSFCTPAIMSWCSTSLAAALALTHILSWPAARTKMIFEATFVAFLAECWTVFVQVCGVAFTTSFAVLVARTGHSVWAAVSTIFLTAFEGFDHIYGHWLGNSSIPLVTVEIFHRYLLFLGILK